MNREEIRETVLNAIAAVLRRPIDPGDYTAGVTRAAVEDWDSLKHMEILLAAEEACGVQFSEEEFSELSGLDDIVAAIEAHRRAP